jgi:hypothetical protein
MRTIIRLLACAAALIAPAEALSQAPETPLPKGRVLLLRNERIFEGEIEKVGEQYRIRRSAGETWLPADKVLRVCESREEAFEYLRKQANLDDPDERLRLARWCLQCELPRHALAECRAAAAMRPSDTEARRLLSHLELAAQSPVNLPAQPIPVPMPSKTEKKSSQATASGLELNAECMGLFASRVQPILLNTCAKCHASGKAGEFKLTQVFGDAPVSGKSAQQNLTAVLSQIKPEQPLNSPLLRMAASAHGGATQPPLRGRDSPAFKTLAQWVQLTAAHAPKVSTAVSDAPSLAAERPGKNISEAVETKPATERFVVQKEASAKPKEEFADTESAKPTGPADEFDPLIFNRQMHPDKK